jgi:hypothetical protein
LVAGLIPPGSFSLSVDLIIILRLHSIIFPHSFSSPKIGEVCLSYHDQVIIATSKQKSVRLQDDMKHEYLSTRDLVINSVADHDTFCKQR